MAVLGNKNRQDQTAGGSILSRSKYGGADQRAGSALARADAEADQRAKVNSGGYSMARDSAERQQEKRQILGSAKARQDAERDQWEKDHGRNIPVVGPVLRGLDAVQEFTEPAAKVGQQIYTPGAPVSAVRAAYGATQGILARVAPKIGNSASLGGKVAREAITETALGAPLTAGNILAHNPDVSGKEFVQQTALGTGIGAAGGVAAPILSRGVSSAVNRILKGRGITDETIAEALSTNTLRDDLAVTTPEAPTTARVVKQVNPYRQKFETLIGEAKRLEADGKLTPGREDEDLRSLWSQMAGPSDPSLDELIDLAYVSRPNRVNPNLVSQARATQNMRAAAGAPPLARTVSAVPPRDMNASQRVLARAEQPSQPAQQPRVMESTPSTTPASVMPDTSQPRQAGVRGFTQTLVNSGKIGDDVRQGIRGLDNRYTIKTNASTVAKANRRIAKDMDEAEGKLLRKNKFAAEDVATGMRLIDEFQKSGSTERAVNVAEKLARQLTEAGQTVQAASIWNRLTPEGALLAAQRKVNTINDNLLKGQEPVKLTTKQADNITSAAGAIQASGTSQERAGTVMEIMDRVRKGEAISGEEKQIVADFVADAKRFLKPADTRSPRPARAPKEMTDARVRDRVVSFLEAQESAAKERLRSKGVNISSNPIDVWADMAYIGALKLARAGVKGTTAFADFSQHMIKEAGESVRPYLRQLYEKSQELLNQSAKKINEQTISQAERIAEGFIKSREATISPDDVQFIRDMAQKVSALSGKERTLASQDLQAVMQGFEKAGVGRKLSAAQYISMLLNPKTQVRNIVGNELMYRLERISRIAATPIDMAVSKITGGPRTITFKRGPKVWDNFFQPSRDYWGSLGEGMSAGWRGVSPEGLTTKYEIQGQAFRSKYNPMTYLEKSLGAVLQGFDYAAYTRAVNQRMSEMAYLDALNKGIKGNDAIRKHMQTYMTNLDDTVHDIAKEYGKFVTLQDDSALARGLMSTRRSLNKLSTFGKTEEFGAGSLILPFAKTPANLLLRGLDYSPAGIVKAMNQAYQVMRKPNTDLTRADVITSVSRALFGTGMGAMAYWLADKGAMFGETNNDSEVRKLQQMTGLKDFQVNGSALMRMLEAAATGGDIDAAAKLTPGDTLWGYEWAQPTSMPMAIGSNVYQSVDQKQGLLKTVGEAASAGVGTLLDSSVLSGLQEAFQIPPGQDNPWKAIVMNIAEQTPSMFTPSLLRNINTLMDEKVKETYTPNDAQSFTAYARSNIPGLSQQMPQRVDTLGQPQTRPNSFFDVFISPSDRSKYKPTKEAQLVIDLMQETGDKNLAPRAVQKYLTGKDAATGLQRKVDLTPEQYVRLQTVVGQETARLISKIDNNLPTDKKVERVLKALDEAGKKGRNEMKKEVGLKISK